MLKRPSGHTGRPFSASMINHRVRGVLRFYTWAVRHGWLHNLPPTAIAASFPLARRAWHGRRHYWQPAERSLFGTRLKSAIAQHVRAAGRRAVQRLFAPRAASDLDAQCGAQMYGNNRLHAQMLCCFARCADVVDQAPFFCFGSGHESIAVKGLLDFLVGSPTMLGVDLIEAALRLSDVLSVALDVGGHTLEAA